ncbi:hypothetical protein G7Y89_g13819 [Cudoniella acicularis]|uniref:Zn(2)-C6 fungal-type domain-containing protein n=1 Tax=Cudoniella acicularis TaxID=354080 RepID=A0A8H4R7I3_9HELO|nr:hypothetical protein G7Y89_g13819 [Cudoniella acicularis]
MVGVGGRSGGCHTCRRRRVKCDENHPKCQRCAKAKIPCEGYARDLKFVDEKGRAQKRVQIKRQAYLEAIQAEEEQLRASRVARLQPTNRPTATGQVPSALSLAGFRDKVELTFMLNKLFAGWRLFIPWIMRGYRGTEDCTTTQAVKALSSIYFGRLHRQKESFDAGMISYCKALRLLGVDLKDPKAAFALPSVTNVLSLVIFEMMASSGGGMIQHLGGVHRLIQARGPERHQTRPELDVFETCRLGMVHNYMEKKKRCFLEEPQWQTVPWAIHPEAKDLLSLLCDRKCFLPGLLEDMEALRTGQRATPADIRNLCQNIHTQLQELYNWRAAWECEYPNCSFLVAIDDPNIPYTSAIHFNSFSRAVEIGHYNTILLQLHRMGRILMGPGFSCTAPANCIPITRTNDALLLPADPKTVQDVGMEFLRMIHFELLQPHESGGYFQVMFPLRVIFEVFRPGSKDTPGLGNWDMKRQPWRGVTETSATFGPQRRTPSNHPTWNGIHTKQCWPSLGYRRKDVGPMLGSVKRDGNALYKDDYGLAGFLRN